MTMASQTSSAPPQCYGCTYGEIDRVNGHAELRCTSPANGWHFGRCVKAKRGRAAFTVAQLNAIPRPKWCPLS